MGVRDAEPRDNDALIALELTAAQGTGIRLSTRRTDYFCRAAQFPGHILLVGEDDKTGQLQGVMGAAPVRVRYGGEDHKGAYIFDWRSAQGTAKGLSLAMFRLWQQLEKRLLAEGVEFLFGYVKKDNVRSAGILQRVGTRIVGTRDFFVLPVFRTLRVRRPVELVPPGELKWSEDWGRLADRFGRWDLFPVREDGEGKPLFDARCLRGQLRSGESRAKIWDDSTQQARVVVDLPRVFRLAGSVAATLSRAIPLPRVPLPGETVRTWELFDLEMADPDEITALVAYANNLARSEGVDYLVVSADSGEPELRRAGRGSLYTLTYYLFVKEYASLPPRGEKAYLDIRCI